MLKQPYELLYTTGDNNYYTLTAGDTQYLITEGVLRYKRWFRKKELTQTVKMLALTSPIMYTLAQFVQVKKTGDSADKGGLEIDEYFELVNINKARKDLKQIIEDLNPENHRFSYDNVPKSGIPKMLMNEGYSYLATELIGSFTNTIWLARSDKNGVIRFVELTFAGLPDNMKLINAQFNVLNLDIAKKLFEREGKE